MSRMELGIGFPPPGLMGGTIPVPVMEEEKQPEGFGL